MEVRDDSKTVFPDHFSPFLAFIGASVVVGVLFPSLPWWSFLGAASLFAVLLGAFIEPRLRRRLEEVLSDERTAALEGRAAGMVHRIVFASSLIFGVVAMQAGRSDPRIFAAGVTAWLISSFQAIIFGVVLAILRKRSS